MKNQSLDVANMDAMQAELRFVEVIGHAAAGEECSVGPVGPLMIRAHQPRRVSRRLGANDRAAMTADVVQRLNCAIVAADDDDGVGVHLEREVVARFGDFARVSGEEPALPPHGLDVGAINLRARIKFLRQRPAGPTLSDQRFNPVQHGLVSR